MLAVGDTIAIYEAQGNEERFGRKNVRKDMQVIGVYSNHVLCIDERGFKRSINKGTLITNGIIKQDKRCERLKKERGTEKRGRRQNA